MNRVTDHATDRTMRSRWAAWWSVPRVLENSALIGGALTLLQLVLYPPATPLHMLFVLAGLAVTATLVVAPGVSCAVGLVLCFASSFIAQGYLGINNIVIFVMFLAVGYVMPRPVAIATPVVYALADAAGFVLFNSRAFGGEFIRGMIESFNEYDADGVVMAHTGLTSPQHSAVVFCCVTVFELTSFGFMTMLGAAFRRTSQTKDRLARTELMLGRIAREQQLAHVIHDSVANDMSTIAMLAWRAKHTDDDTAMVDAIYARSQHAIDRMHEVIDVLNGQLDLATLGEERQGGGDAASDGMAFDARLEKYLEDQDRAMSMIGIHGVSRLGGESDAEVPAPVRREVMNLIEEIYANIVRHCDLDGELTGDEPAYHLFVDIAERRIRVSEFNALNDERLTMVYRRRHGNGLELHRAAIEALGGTFNAAAQDGTWLLSAELPW